MYVEDRQSVVFPLSEKCSIVPLVTSFREEGDRIELDHGDEFIEISVTSPHKVTYSNVHNYIKIDLVFTVTKLNLILNLSIK